MHVVDEDEERLVGRHLGREAEGGGRDQKPVRLLRLGQAERGGKRGSLRLRHTIEAIQDRVERLMEARKGELGLRFDTSCAKNSHPRRSLSRVGEQRRLADPRPSAKDERSAGSPAGSREQRLDPFALG
jgi:hypothetical protein